MLTSTVHRSSPAQTLIQWHKPFIFSETTAPFLLQQKSVIPKREKSFRVRSTSTTIKPMPSSTEKSTRTTTVKVVVTVLVTPRGFLLEFLSNLEWSRWLDYISDLFGRSLLLELVPAELDPSKSFEI